MNVMTATAIAPDDLHTDLRPHIEALNEALNMEIPPTWPEGENYLEAPQIANVGTIIRQASHTGSSGARLAYVFRKEWSRRDKPEMGKVTQATGLLRYLAEVDYVLQVNWTIWIDLSPRARLALIDHLLETIYADPESGTWKIRDPDVNEFISILNRWGSWNVDLQIAGGQLKLL